MTKKLKGLIVFIAGVLLTVWLISNPAQVSHLINKGVSIGLNSTDYYSPVEEIPPEQRTTADLILLGARREAENKTSYDASYQVIDYPGGDVHPDYGACTDVIIRAYRHAGIDLQVLIHEDMADNFELYPGQWGLTEPDTNIDHRRIPNQVQFFKRFGTELSREVEGHLEEWQWGDIVYWKFANGLEHCGIVSDRKCRDGIPLVIHNTGVTREEDALLRWKITGHYRYLP